MNSRRNSILLTVILILVGVLACILINMDRFGAKEAATGDRVDYERAVVEEILSDSCEEDPLCEGGSRGTQSLTARILSGACKGKVLLMDNTVGPLYGQQLEPGDRVIASISTYENGEIRAYVYEYDRSIIIFCLIAAFLAVTVLVGRGTGVRSLIGLLLTVFALLFALLPLLLKGAPSIITTFACCVWVACTSFAILGGISKKTVCAFLGTAAGMAVSMLFGLAAQHLLRINGYRQEYADALLLLRRSGESMIGIKGLIVCGVIISALGAVMDVAMSISSSMQEIASVGKDLTRRSLLTSGMNVGRDMVGTMTNTLILAIMGSSLTLIVYIASLGLPVRQFLSSAYFSLEIISGLASSFGVILAVPFTALICSAAYVKKGHSGSADTAKK